MRVFARTETQSVLWPMVPSKPELGALTPPGPLGRYVASVRWGRERFASEVCERVLPDGAVHLFFDLGDAKAATVAGARCKPTVLRLSGQLEHIGLELRPGAVEVVLGVPARSLSGMDVPLEALWGRGATELLERLAEVPSAARPKVLGAALVDRMRGSARAPDRRATAAVQRIVGARGGVHLRDIANAVGVGERRLEQIFARDVGLGPKAWSRLARFRSAIDIILGSTERSWAKLAQVCGYYDQAHMTHEFRSLAGATPAALASFGFFQEGGRLPG